MRTTDFETGESHTGHRIVGGALIQSTFGSRNFEAVVLMGPEPNQQTGRLQHYWLDTSRPDRTWQRGQEIYGNATGAGCLIQSTFGSPGNFEVVVPAPIGLVHCWHDNSDKDRVWSSATLVAPGSTGPGSLVQNRENGNLEVVVLHGQELRHYWRDAAGWHPGPVITRRASGPACLIQSTYWGNLELVVLEGSDLVHYWRDESEAPVMKWLWGGVITSRATGPAGFTQPPYDPLGLLTGSPSTNPNPNFEVVVPEGDVLAHYWRDNTDGNLPWYSGGVVTHRAGPINAATLIHSSFANSLEVLSQENDGSIYHYYRYQDGGRLIWFRGPCLKVTELDEPDADRTRPLSTKIVQLTGEKDAQLNDDAFNRTETAFGIRGTDLGASFFHRGRIYFLFGDTHWTHSIKGTLDSIAYTTTRDAARGLALQFHLAYPEIVRPSVSQFEYEVPLDGFSFAEQMFVFFSTDFGAQRKVMGRSVLTRCLEAHPDFVHSRIDTPLQFQYLVSFSNSKFINVSVERVNAAALREYRLPANEAGLLIWGTGAYRADNIYLAFLPLDERRTHERLLGFDAFPAGQLGLLYFTGERDGVPTWSAREDDAVPLFYPAAIGELSVRWNRVLKRWVCLYCAGPEDPIRCAVVMRIARTPWGPWSRRRLVLDWCEDGLGRRKDARGERLPGGWFIHDGEADPPDTLGDTIIANRLGKAGGAAYAPYQLPYYTQQTRSHRVRSYTLYYVLSTWNPYQVMLMSHELSFRELEALG
jgi:hypothetical protein